MALALHLGSRHEPEVQTSRISIPSSHLFLGMRESLGLGRRVIFCGKEGKARICLDGLDV
jgi:hypothetical protein